MKRHDLHTYVDMYFKEYHCNMKSLLGCGYGSWGGGGGGGFSGGGGGFIWHSGAGGFNRDAGGLGGGARGFSGWSGRYGGELGGGTVIRAPLVGVCVLSSYGW